MRISLISLALLVAGCVQQAPPPPAPPVVTGPTPCTPEAMLDLGMTAQPFPEQCQGDAYLIDRHQLGFAIFRVERDIKAVERARTRRRNFNTPVFLGGRDISERRGFFRGDGGLTIERARLRSIRKNLRNQAGLSECKHCKN